MNPIVSLKGSPCLRAMRPRDGANSKDLSLVMSVPLHYLSFDGIGAQEVKNSLTRVVAETYPEV